MASAKDFNEHGCQLVVEGSYLAGVGTPDADDGFFLVERPEPDLPRQFEGDRGMSPTGGRMKRTAMKGIEGSVDLVTHAFTPGAGDYSSSAVVPSVDRLLRLGMFDAAFDTDTWTYTLSPRSSWESGAARLFFGGDRVDIDGLYLSELAVEADGPVVPVWTGSVMGRGTAPTEATVPSLNYLHDDEDPVIASEAALSINSVTSLIVKSFRLSVTRTLHSRVRAATLGHFGFTPGRDRVVRLAVTVESPARATFNPEALMDAGTAFATTLILAGGVAGREIQFNLPQGTIVSAEVSEDGDTTMYDIEVEAHVSAPGEHDELNIVFT